MSTNATRRFFIDLVKKHQPPKWPEPTLENIDTIILALMMMAITAAKAGRPDSVPWFTKACAGLLEQEMESLSGKERTIN